MLKNSLKFLQHKYVNVNLHTKPDFTKNVFNVTRGDYRKPDEHHFHYFRQILAENQILTDLSDLEKYNVNWYTHLRGAGTIVLQPSTSDQVSKILSFCDQNNLAVCTQGGNTGLVGGSTPVFDEIILSMEKMNQILHLDEDSGILTCESGCILQTVNDFLAEKNLLFPLDLGAKGSCQIGGNISTNAGGTRLFKYGNMHGNVLGLEAVRANGQILDCMSTLKKDNTGYHLKHLFIGSEGTLGVVTKVAVQCRTRPKTLNVAFLGLQSFDRVVETFKRAKADLDEILTAFEVMDTATMELVGSNLGLASPIGAYPFYALIETTGSDEGHDQAKIERFLGTCLDKHLILNGTVASDSRKAQQIWELRERIPQGFAQEGFVYMYDVSLPLQHYYQLVEELRAHMGALATHVFGFGHLGDGNLHVQVSAKERSEAVTARIEPFIYERTKQYNGSISAEHGVGFLKCKYLDFMNSASAVELMKTLKISMDPNRILNPYKMINKF